MRSFSIGFAALVFSIAGSTGCGGDGDSSAAEGDGGIGGGLGAGGGLGEGGGLGNGGGQGTGGAPPTGGPPLPTPTGTCPEFVDGNATFTAGGQARQVRLWVNAGAAAGQDGPLVLYWYGTGGQPTQAVQGLGQAGIDRITAAGGVVAAPVHVSTGGGIFPWLSGGPEDLALTDEIVGCAMQKIGIDARHLHTLGFSAGALFTGRLSIERSSLFASVATYSGGGGGAFQDPNNKFAAMIINGGPGDMVVLNFQTASQDYYGLLTGAGHFAFICNHGGGHRIPSDAVPNVVQFFFDHPYGTVPSPYASGLPSGFPAYCTL